MATYPPRPNGLTAIHLCSGYGGFELGLRPWGVRTVAHVERDSYAAAILMERMGEARLDQAPIWDDLTTFDGEPWRGRVDILTAGFPCQPFSNAGTRRGLDDDRWLWPAIARIVAQVRPSFVMLENVPPVVRAGLPAVLQDLAQIGFDAEWGMYSAADIGAPHKRQRWWCVAYASSERLSRVSGIPHGAESETKRRINSNADHIVKRNVEAVADTESKRRQQVTGSALSVQGTDGERTRDHIVKRDVKTLADTDGYGLQEVGVNELPGRDDLDRRNGADVADTESNGSPTIIAARDSRPNIDRSGSWARPAEPDPVADTDSARRDWDGNRRERSPLGDAARSGNSVADTEGARRESSSQQHQQQHAIHRLERHRFPPTRSNTEGWATWIAEGRPQPVVCRNTDGPPTGLADALHLGGNGLVPQSATEAIRQLLDRAGWELGEANAPYGDY